MVEIRVAEQATGTARRAALLALALGAFGVGCTEFVAVGLLPGIAADLHVPQGSVGQLVTLNAAAVALGAPLIGTLVARQPARPVLIGTLAVFAAAHLAAAAAPGFVPLLLSRLVTGVAFGLYLAVAFAVAARLADGVADAAALATVQAGVTTATVLGVPLGSWLAGAVGSAGWRLPFVAIAVISLAAAGAIARAVPHLPARPEVSLRDRLGSLGRGPVALGVVTIVVFWAASFCAFTFIVPLLTERSGLPAPVVPALLLLAGLTSVAGTVLGGRAADRAPGRTLTASAVATLLALAVLFGLPGTPVVAVGAVLAWQLAAWCFVPAVQARILALGGDEGEAALSFSVAAFNVGIVIGAGTGGLAIGTAGLGAVGGAAIGLAATALALVVALNRRSRAGGST